MAKGPNEERCGEVRTRGGLFVIGGWRGEGLEAEALWAAVGVRLDALERLTGFHLAPEPAGLGQAGAPPRDFDLAAVGFVEDEADFECDVAIAASGRGLYRARCVGHGGGACGRELKKPSHLTGWASGLRGVEAGPAWPDSIIGGRS